jgi:hypothetical protein
MTCFLLIFSAEHTHLSPNSKTPAPTFLNSATRWLRMVLSKSSPPRKVSPLVAWQQQKQRQQQQQQQDNED